MQPLFLFILLVSACSGTLLLIVRPDHAWLTSLEQATNFTFLRSVTFWISLSRSVSLALLLTVIEPYAVLWAILNHVVGRGALMVLLLVVFNLLEAVASIPSLPARAGKARLSRLSDAEVLLHWVRDVLPLIFLWFLVFLLLFR